MYHYFKIILNIVVFIWCICTLKKSWEQYKEKKETSDLIEVIAKVLLIPSSIILLIAEFIG